MRRSGEIHVVFLFIVGLLGWLIPGAGHFTIDEKKRAFIIFTAIVLTFVTGLYVGSIGIVNPESAKSWYVAQLMNSPLVALFGQITVARGYTVYGKPNEIGQIYTSIAGLLNLLCIVNAVYLAHLKRTRSVGD